MALIKCYECEREISDKAPACPHCGAPKGGKKDGVYKTYYENGQLLGKGTWVAGELDGPCETYHENGQLEWKGTISGKTGELDGPFEDYYENGQLRRKGTIVAGELHGPCETYHEDGQLQQKGGWNMGEAYGEWMIEGEARTYPPSPISRRQSEKSSEQIREDSKRNQEVRRLLELSKKYGKEHPDTTPTFKLPSTPLPDDRLDLVAETVAAYLKKKEELGLPTSGAVLSETYEKKKPDTTQAEEVEILESVAAEDEPEPITQETVSAPPTEPEPARKDSIGKGKGDGETPETAIHFPHARSYLEEVGLVKRYVGDLTAHVHGTVSHDPTVDFYETLERGRIFFRYQYSPLDLFSSDLFSSGDEVEIPEGVAAEDEPEPVAQEPEWPLVDYMKGRREDAKWVWREGPIERERILERLKDAKSEKKEKSTD